MRSLVVFRKKIVFVPFVDPFDEFRLLMPGNKVSVFDVAKVIDTIYNDLRNHFPSIVPILFFKILAFVVNIFVGFA